MKKNKSEKKKEIYITSNYTTAYSKTTNRNKFIRLFKCYDN